uniref:G-protein coupled receptors family 3 profile domain-containing protein n=1 Tax=Amphimedon queenslandica TaxID=400682 RepID=A0A1X7UIU2_AMPQE
MCLNTVVSQRIPLNFGYITTLTGSFIGDGGIPVVDMALRLINERNDVLQNYTLNYTDVLDSACDRTMSLNQFFELINRNTTYISLLGCGCSPATIPVAELSHYWNIPQLSVVSAANSLDNRIKFRNFYRTSVPFHDVGESLGQLMREFGWRQMSIITQDESLFSLVTENISNIFNNEGWTLDRYDSETGSFRIFHINAYQDMAYQLLCEAYHRGMTGSDYLWIIPMWYNDNWWMSSSPTSSTNPSCTDAIMMEVITGTIGWIPRKYLTLNESITTFSGLTPNAYLGNYTALLQESRYRNITKFGFSGVVFDGVWAIAIGLDIASKKISSGNDSGCENVPGDLVPLEQFNYANTKLGCIFKKSFNEIDFVGVTGQVKFNEFGSRNDEFIQYQQYRLSNSRLTKVHFGSVYVEGQRSSFVFSSGESNSTLWKDGIPPYDGIPERGLDQNSIALIVIYDILAGFGIIFAAVCFIFNVVFRNKKYAMMYKTTEAVFCNVRVWLFSLGYCLCFGVILSKTWRVYHIFNNPKPTKKGVKDWFLFLIVSFIIAIDVFIILIGTIVPQSRLTSFEVVDGENPQIINDDGKLQNNFVVVCNTRTETLIWEGLSFGYKGILQVLAIFMAFHTRGVKVRILNESKETAAIIYINSIVLLLLTVTEFTLATRHNTYSALFGLGLLIEASLFLGLIFIPKASAVALK